MTSSKNSSWLRRHASNSLLTVWICRFQSPWSSSGWQKHKTFTTWSRGHSESLPKSAPKSGSISSGREPGHSAGRPTHKPVSAAVKRASWPKRLSHKIPNPFLSPATCRVACKHKRLNSPIFSAVAPCISSIWLL